MITVREPDAFAGMVGEDLGTTGWFAVEQADVSGFAERTGDDEPIHLDPAAARSAGFDGTIAHGLFTLSLGPKFLHELYRVERYRLALNYGFDKVRFIAPVPVGSKVRMSATVVSVDPIDGGWKVTIRQEFRCENSERPACVADAVVAYFN